MFLKDARAAFFPRVISSRNGLLHDGVDTFYKKSNKYKQYHSGIFFLVSDWRMFITYRLKIIYAQTHFYCVSIQKEFSSHL